MKPKHLFILGIIFASLAAVALIQKAYQQKVPVEAHLREVWKPFVPADQVTRILFLKPKYPPLSLSRDQSSWKVDSLSGAAADTYKINTILDRLNHLHAEWRAEGENFFDRFGVMDDQAFRLQILNVEGGAILDFYIGAKRAGSGTFIRLINSDKIYFVREDLPALFGLYGDLKLAAPLPIFFADLRLVPESFEQIQRFDVVEFRDGKKITRAAVERSSVKVGARWKFVKDFGTFSPGFEKIESYLSRLTGAHGENIVPAQAGWIPDFEIMLRDGRGKVLRLEFSKVQDMAGTGRAEQWLVKRENSPQIFEVSGLVVEDLKIQDAALIEDNPLQIEIDPGYSVEMQDEKRTEFFSHESGWPTAAAILDALTRLRFLREEPGITAKDLEGFPPTHRVQVKKLGVDVVELRFYAGDPQLREIKTAIAGQDTIYVVSRSFFQTLFISQTAPPDGGDESQTQASDDSFIML